MKISKVAAFLTVFAIIATGCNKVELDNNSQSLESQYFVKVDNIQDLSAEVTIIPYNTGDEEWFSFYTEDKSTDVLSQVQAKIKDMLITGKFDTGRTGEVEGEKITGLTQMTQYRYIVFGISAEGELNKNNIKAVSFTTLESPYRQCDNWSTEFSGYRIVKTKEGDVDCVTLTMKQQEEINPYYYPILINQKVYDAHVEQGDTDQDMAKELGQSLQYRMTTLLSSDDKLTMDDLALKGSTSKFEDPRYSEMSAYYSGDYVVFTFGFNEDGTTTKAYSKTTVTLTEPKARESYNKWLGTWKVSDGTNWYDITFHHLDNNFSYYVSGWETGDHAINDINKLPIVKPGSNVMIEARYCEETKGIAFESQPLGAISNHEMFGFFGFFTYKSPQGNLPMVSFDLYFDSNKIAEGKMESGQSDKAVLTPVSTNLLFVDDNMIIHGRAPITYEYFKFGLFDVLNAKTKTYNNNTPVLNKGKVTMTKIAELPEGDNVKPTSCPQAKVEPKLFLQRAIWQ